MKKLRNTGAISQDHISNKTQNQDSNPGSPTVESLLVTALTYVIIPVCTCVSYLDVKRQADGNTL
jgi:hypothetical protein